VLARAVTPSPRTFLAFLQRPEAVEPHELQLLLLGYEMRGYHLTVRLHAALGAPAPGRRAARLLPVDVETLISGSEQTPTGCVAGPGV